MGDKVPEGTESHRARGLAGNYWVRNEADVRRMTEAAGFDDVAIIYARPAGDHRVVNPLLRRFFGTDEEAIVAAVKPVPVRSADDARAEEAVAVG